MTEQPGTLADAANAYHAAAHDEAVAGRAVTKAQRRRTEADGRKREARAVLAAAIVEEFTSGRSTQAEIVAVTRYSRERVRQILRAAEVDPEESVERARESRRR